MIDLRKEYLEEKGVKFIELMTGGFYYTHEYVHYLENKLQTLKNKPFRVGDVLKITPRTLSITNGHLFNVGDFVKVISIDNECPLYLTYKCRSLKDDGTDYWININDAVLV